MEAQGAGGGEVAGPAQTVTHYELLEKLGEGGMGSVFKARDVRLERLVALKFPLPELLDTPEVRSRFLREARALSSLSHPNIATVFEVDEAGGTPFLVLEYLPGGTLRGRIRVAAAAGRPIPVSELVELARVLADGLGHAHRQGIVHRDVKSGNIMFGAEGRPKLTDFGLAKVTGTGEQSSSGSVLGTLAYMSPEQASGEVVDQRSDLYSLGVVMYEAATGRLPFQGDSPAAVVHQIMNTEPDPPSRLRADLPPAYDAIVLRLLAKAPARRYQHAEELVVDLRALPEPGDKSIFRALTVSLREPWKKLRRTRRRWLAATAAGVLLAAGGAYTGYRPLQRWLRARHLPNEMHLAVLPFRSIGGDEGQQAFCAGLTERVTTYLACLRELSVESATQTSNLKDAKQAWAQLGVSLVAEGSVERLGDQVRVRITLVDAERQRAIGASQKDWPIAQLAGIGGDLLSMVADLLNLALPRGPQGAPAAQASEVPTAEYAYLLGRGFLNRYDRPGNLENAKAKFQEAILADKKFAAAYVGLAEAHLRTYAVRREPDQLESAYAAARQAVELNDRLADAHRVLGRTYVETGHSSEAAGHLERARRLDPLDPRTYEALGNWHDSQGKPAEAERTYKQAVEARPWDWQSHHLLAIFYFNHQREAEAEPAFRRAIALAPRNHILYRNLGATLSRLCRNDQAETMLRAAIAIYPGPANNSNLGAVLMFQRKYPEALEAMEKAKSYASREAAMRYRSWGNLGDAYWYAKAGRDKAVEAWKQAIQVAEQRLKGSAADAVILSEVATYHAKLGNRRQAEERISQALKHQPGNARIHYQASLIYALRKDSARALAELEQAAPGYSNCEIRAAPELEELHSDPRFEDILKRAGRR
ncbi:MAG: tetratricopeptide repeat protein [Acidobacteria bacterium]|nr:tetratricopeptide repeat protein [Acidobacteriota bacterium]